MMTMTEKDLLRTASHADREGVGELCGTCIHAVGCALAQQGVRPVECNEFEDERGTGLNPCQVVHLEDGTDEGFAGLCHTCELRHDCAQAHGGEVVFYCEEFR